MHSRYAAILGLVFTSIFWSGNIYVSKILLGEVSPVALNLIRWTLAFVVLTPFAIKQTLACWSEIKRSIIQLSIFGFLGVTAYNSLLYSAAYTTGGINIALISTLTPLATFIVAWIYLGQAPTAKQNSGFILGIIGVLFLLGQGSIDVLMAMRFKAGDQLMLIAVALWAIYTVYSTKKPKGLSALTFLYVTTLLGALMTIPAAMWEWHAGQFMFVVNSTSYKAIIYVGIFPSVVSYLLFNYGVAVLGAKSASLCSYLLPVFTAIIAILFLGESIRYYHVVSQVFVFTGLFVALSGNNARKTDLKLLGKIKEE